MVCHSITVMSLALYDMNCLVSTFLSQYWLIMPLTVFSSSQAADLFLLNYFYDVLWNNGPNYQGGKNSVAVDKATKKYPAIKSPFLAGSSPSAHLPICPSALQPSSLAGRPSGLPEAVEAMESEKMPGMKCSLSNFLKKPFFLPSGHFLPVWPDFHQFWAIFCSAQTSPKGKIVFWATFETFFES